MQALGGWRKHYERLALPLCKEGLPRAFARIAGRKALGPRL